MEVKPPGVDISIAYYVQKGGRGPESMSKCVCNLWKAPFLVFPGFPDSVGTQKAAFG